VFFAIYNIFKEISAVAWSSWMRDLIPAHIRGEIYSKRVAYGKFVALFVVLAFTVLFSLLGKLTFSLLFFVAFVAGIGAVVFGIPALSLAVSAMFILLMSGLILFQTSQILHGGETNYIMATITLYIAIYNLFLSLLQILGIFGGDD
jgi:FtsH-binding integral membrane protein